ncbi:hypothetical protein GFS60_06931 (plasmid) [Rhodococcus sp. WAY2]|nr:hypothetical protein GFS60_06931 [Rhodococcus sp. WAY2]
MSGVGKVYNYTVSYRDFGLSLPRPYATAYVELEDVPSIRLATNNIFGCRVDDLHIGLDVEVMYHGYDDAELTLAYLSPRTLARGVVDAAVGEGVRSESIPA